MSADTDLATLRGFSGPDLAPGYDAALDRLEAKVATLRKERDALAEAQQFPVETVMSWKRRAESAERMIRYARVLLDPERQDEQDEENALRAYEALSGVPLSVEAGLPSAIRQLEAAEARCARLQQALEACGDVLFGTWDDDKKKREAHREAERLAREALAGPDTPADLAVIEGRA